MGNCGSTLDCNKAYTPNGDGESSKLEIESDIAGFGFLLAFFISTCISFLLLVWAYLTHALPRTISSQTDVAVIQWLSFKRYGSEDVGSTSPHRLDRDGRIAVIERFLLALSDQQVVSGLALMITALRNRCTLSLIELELIVGLIWFSATTHDVSLIVLREYFYRHKKVRNFRVLVTVAFLVLFVVCDSASTSSSNWGGFGFKMGKAFNAATPLQCVFKKSNPNGRASDPTDIYPMLLLLLAYVLDIIYLYMEPRRSDAEVDRMTNEMYETMLRWRKHTNCNDIVETAHANYSAWMQSSLNNKSSGAKVSFWLVTQRFDYSFLSVIPRISFVIVYNSVRMFKASKFAADYTKSDLTEVTFGQMVSLVLLSLPIVAAWESYNEEREKRKATARPTLAALQSTHISVLSSTPGAPSALPSQSGSLARKPPAVYNTPKCTLKELIPRSGARWRDAISGAIPEHTEPKFVEHYIAKCAFCMFLVAMAFQITTAVGIHFEQIVWWCLVALWCRTGFNFVLGFTRICLLELFIRHEIKRRKPIVTSSP